MKKTKKAISPLIATILLVVVAVALIAIVVAWGKSFTTKNLEKADDPINMECMGAAIDIVDCSLGDNNITLTIKNIGTIDLKSVFNLSAKIGVDGTLTKATAPTESFDLDRGQLVIKEFTVADVNSSTDVTNLRLYAEQCPADAVASLPSCK